MGDVISVRQRSSDTPAVLRSCGNTYSAHNWRSALFCFCRAYEGVAANPESSDRILRFGTLAFCYDAAQGKIRALAPMQNSLDKTLREIDIPGIPLRTIDPDGGKFTNAALDFAAYAELSDWYLQIGRLNIVLSKRRDGTLGIFVTF